MSNIDKFKKLYNFEFEEIKVDSFEEVSKKYLTLYKEGKEKGYIPLFLTVDEYLLKTFKITMANENVDNMIDIFDKNLLFLLFSIFKSVYSPTFYSTFCYYYSRS